MCVRVYYTRCRLLTTRKGFEECITATKYAADAAKTARKCIKLRLLQSNDRVHDDVIKYPSPCNDAAQVESNGLLQPQLYMHTVCTYVAYQAHTNFGGWICMCT